MTCAEVRPTLAGYADDDPPEAIRSHLASCDSCSRELTGFRDLRSMTSALRDEEEFLPFAFRQRTMARLPLLRGRIEEARRGAVQLLGTPGRATAASVGGALVAAAAVAVVWRRGRRRSLEAA